MNRVFVTGATGLVGGEVVRRIATWDPGASLVLLLRARRGQTITARRDALLGDLFPRQIGAGSPRARVTVVEGDLAADRLGLDQATWDELAATVTDVVHLGADVRFDQPLDQARSVQVDGTRRVADLAEAAAAHHGLRSFVYVSTYAAGRSDGGPVVPEAPPTLDRTFRNTYEQTKAEAERLLLERGDRLPLTIARLGIVVGHSRTGWTQRFDMFYLPIRFLLADDVFAGIDLRVPISRRARYNTVTIDDAADILYWLYRRDRREEATGIFHVTPGTRASPVPAATEQMMGEFAAAHRRREMPMATLPEIVPVDDLTPERAAAVLGTAVAPELMAVILSTMPYAFDEVVFDNTRLLRALRGTGLEPRPLLDVIEPLVDYIVRTDWGARPDPRPPLGPPPA